MFRMFRFGPKRPCAAASTDYRPQPGTSPLYEFCKLQTLMLRDLDQVQLREVVCVCETECVTKLCVTKLCVKDGA